MKKGDKIWRSSYLTRNAAKRSGAPAMLRGAAPGTGSTPSAGWYPPKRNTAGTPSIRAEIAQCLGFSHSFRQWTLEKICHIAPQLILPAAAQRISPLPVGYSLSSFAVPNTNLEIVPVSSQACGPASRLKEFRQDAVILLSSINTAGNEDIPSFE